MHTPGGARMVDYRGSHLTWLLLLLWSGCSEVLDPDDLDVTMLPDPPAVTAPLMIKGALKDAALLQGADGSPWAAVKMADGLAVSLQRLMPPFVQQLVAIDRVSYSSPPSQSMCTVFKLPSASDYQVALRRPGETSFGQVVLSGSPVVLCGQRTLATYPSDLDPTRLDILRRKPSGEVVPLRLPWPRGAIADWDQGPRGFDENEQVVVMVDGDYRTQLYYLDTPAVTDLGPVYLGGPAAGHYFYEDYDGFLHAYVIAEHRNLDLGFRLSPDGQILGLDIDHLALITCDWDGVRQVAVRPARRGSQVVGAQRVLDPQPCRAEYSTLNSFSGSVVYTHDGALRAVSLDGSSPPRLLSSQSVPQTLAICQDRAVAYSLDSPERYGKGIGDGWISDYRFMERGRDVRFSPDCKRVHFKEHSADLRKLGELQSLRLVGDGGWDHAERLRLARNVGLYQDLPDGRILVADNLAVIGPQNRISLIDEDRRTAQVLLQGLGAVTGGLPLSSYFPGYREWLVEVDTPELDNDRYLLLLPVPSLPPPPLASVSQASAPTGEARESH